VSDWLLNEILTGMQKLLTLSLDRTPAMDLITGTARTWHEAITYRRVWDEERDADRVRDGFARLALNAKRWPTVDDLITALPSAPTQWRLPAPTNIPATREEKARRLASLLGKEYNPETAGLPDSHPAMSELRNPPSANEE
jgi:hypothetical protein